ncbi:MAG: putative sulfate exporter family transporter, partial [Rhizomicrobium sp.]
MSDPVHAPTTSAAFAEAVVAVLPGLTLTGGIALAAFALRQIPGMGMFSPMILATVIGMAFHNLVGTPALCRPGVVFSLKKILRLGIILLGFQLMLSQVVAVGAVGVGIILVTLAATFVFTKTLGRVMGVDPKLAELIGAGTSICGASAVIATNTVTQGKDSDVAYAVACVTVFGSLAMLLYPLLPGLLHLSPRDFGLWSGASIHEIAQVVAASFQDGQAAGQFGTVAKLTRVMMLAPLVIGLGFLAARKMSDGDKADHKAPPMPWFVLGFIAVMLLNSVISVAPHEKAQIVILTNFLLSMALAAMGLETDFAKL